MPSIHARQTFRRPYNPPVHPGQKLFLPLFFILGLTACVNLGHNLHPSVLQQLSTGQTREHVHQLFGKPKESIQGPNGNRLDVFAYISDVDHSHNGRSAEIEVRSLHVLYDSEKKVIKHTSHTGPMKWADDLWGREAIPQNLVNLLQRGVTRRADLIASFGPATMEGFDVRGRTTLSWVFSKGSSYPHRIRELIALLDDDGVLRDYRFREQN